MAMFAIPALRAQSLERELVVSVVDSEDRPVGDLGPERFVVREDGRQREVLRVSRAATPMQIAVLVDTSQAATRPMVEMRDALDRFVTAMHRGNEIAIVTFGDRPTILVDYTNSLESLQSAIRRLFAMPGSGAYLLDAMDLVLRGIERRESRRPVILALTTEGIEYSTTYYRAVLDKLESTGAAFHALVVETDRTAVVQDEAGRDRAFVVAEGTKLSGGRRDELLTSQAIDDTMARIATDLSQQYLVVYARPDSLIPPKRIEVAVTGAGLEARATPVRAGTGS
jgi:Ca-activated chloride channel family protein